MFFPNVVVWGEEYVKTFLDVTVPTLLAGGNLPALKGVPGAELIIVCPQKERQLLQGSAALRACGRHVPVQFIDIDWDMGAKSQPILNMSEGHRRVCERVREKEGYAIFLSPDGLISSNALAHLLRLAGEGVRCVAAPGFRLTKERVEPVLRERVLDHTLALSGRDMVALFNRFKHPEMLGYYVDAPSFSAHPVYCFYPFNDRRNMVVRAFHLHPLMLQIPSCATLDALQYDTIDADFAGNVVGDFGRIHVVRDLDDIAIFSMTSENERAPDGAKRSYEPERFGRWSYGSMVHALHRFYVTHPILARETDVDEAELQALVDRSARDALLMLATPTLKELGLTYQSYAVAPSAVGNPRLAGDIPLRNPLDAFTTVALALELWRRLRRQPPPRLLKAVALALAPRKNANAIRLTRAVAERNLTIEQRDALIRERNQLLLERDKLIHEVQNAHVLVERLIEEVADRKR